MDKRTKKTVKLISAPQLPDGANKILPNGRIEEATQYHNLEISDIDISSQTGSRISIEQTLFRHVAMNDTKFPLLKLNDIFFDSCDLANAEWHKASINRIEIVGCRLTGYKVVEGVIRDALIKDCKADFTQFTFSKFKDA
ncbi:MAG: hypothetical protein AB1489_42820, partial [Acidobacteriota bacterium]